MTTIFRASEKRKRRKLLARSEPDELPPLRLTQRDLAILGSGYEYGALTTPLIEQLHFAKGSGRETRCRKRLQRLYHHGYLWRDEQPTKLSQGRAPLVYRLDRKGAILLAELWGLELRDLDWDRPENAVSSPYLTHLLKTNEVRVAIVLAAGRHGLTIEEWLDDATLRKAQNKDYVTITGPHGGKQKAAIVPDGYFHLAASDYDYHHLLEIDLATVTGQSSRWGRRDWARKIRAYVEYDTSGLYRQRYGTSSLRILTVTTGPRRLSNLKEIAQRVGGKARFWFTTFDQLSPETALSQPIWQVAGRGPEQFTLLW